MSKMTDEELCKQDAKYELYIADLQLNQAKEINDTYQIDRLQRLIKDYQQILARDIPDYQARHWATNCARVKGATSSYIAEEVPSRQEVDDPRLTIWRHPETDTWTVQEWDDEPHLWTLSEDGMWDDRVRHAIFSKYGTLHPER